jgi:membrane fusion protein, heavy metal efflux system
MRTWRILALAYCSIMAGCARAPAGDAADSIGWQVHGELLQWRGKAPPAFVRLGTVGQADGRVAHAAGRIVWNDHTTARVFTPVNGRVEALLAEPGAQVRRGQPLLELSSGDFGQWQSELRKAQADALAARRADARARDLLAAGVIAQRDAEQTEADRQRADAELTRAQTRLQQMGEHSNAVNGNFVLRSPIDGVVVDRVASVGTEVRADATIPLFVITNPDKLNIVVDLPEYLAPLVKPGTELAFTRSGVGMVPGRARLTAVPAAVDPITRTVRARGVVISEHAGIPGEAYVQVDIPIGASGGTTVMVPSDALVLVGSRYYAYTVARQQYQRRAVTIGELGNPLVEVKSGLQVGESIVVDGSLYLEQLLEQGTGG